jgi:hypothetical protein
MTEFKLEVPEEMVEKLKEEIKTTMIDTTFEKNKLKAYLGKEYYSMLKETKAFVAGGMITSLFTNKEINDVDIYFRDDESAYQLADYFLDGSSIVSSTNKALQYIDHNNNQLLVQLIHYKFYDKAEDIFESFDFTINMGAFDFEKEQFVLHKEFLKHNSQRILKLGGKTDYPLITATRLAKYEDRGYKVSKAEMFRIMLSCMNLDINTYDELKEHLGGMYGEMYNKLVDELDENKPFDLEYVIEELGKLVLSENYFDVREFGHIDKEAALENMDKSAKIYVDTKWGLFKDRYGKLLDSKFKLSEVEQLEGVTILKGEDYFKDYLAVKYVQEKDGELVSYYTSSFKYTLNEEVVPEKSIAYNGGKLFFNTLHNEQLSPFSSNVNRVLLYAKINYDDIVSLSEDEVHVTKCVPVKVERNGQPYVIGTITTDEEESVDITF